MRIELSVNGEQHTADVSPDTPLLWVLRENLGLIGTKFGCGRALCGACTIHVDDMAVRSCSYPVELAAGKQIRTIEGLTADPVGRAVTDAWVDLDVVQCGWCQPGQCMAATALLRVDKSPDDNTINGAMSGNVCRCGAYPRIRAAIHAAAQRLGEDGR